MRNQVIHNNINSHNPSLPDNILNHSNNIGRGARVRESDDYFHNRLDIDVERIVAQRTQLTAAQKNRQEIEARGKIVKDFMVGNTRIKINDAYCRDKTPAEVDAILKGIAIRVQEQLSAQAAASLTPAE